MMPPPPMEGPSATTDTTATTEQSQPATEQVPEDTAEDPLAICDVDKWNKDFMQRSEELYEALMNSHWEPLDSVDSPIPSMS